MQIELSTIWAAAAVLIGLQSAAFTWRVSREIAVAESGDINWLPPADIMNLVSMVVALVGVFVLPLGGVTSPNVPRLALGFSITLFAGYPFALAGHYDLYRKGRRSYAYAPRQEIVAVSITALVAVVFLAISL